MGELTSSNSTPPENPAVNEREQAKRVQFFHAAEPLFERFGFKKTTVEEICEAAQASKRTFYELFSDKSDIFIQLLFHITDDMIQDYSNSLNPNSTATEQIDLYLNAYLRAINNRPVFRLILEDTKLIQQMATSSHDKLQMEEIVRAFTEIIQYGIDTGEFRPMEPGIITWIVHALMDGLYLLGSDMHPQEGFVESDEFINEVKAFILNGLGVRNDSTAGTNR